MEPNQDIWGVETRREGEREREGGREWRGKKGERERQMKGGVNVHVCVCVREREREVYRAMRQIECILSHIKSPQPCSPGTV